MADEAQAANFTPSETKLLISIMKNLEGDLKVRMLDLLTALMPSNLVSSQSNFAAVAEECGLKDASIAKTRWGQIRRKKIRSSTSSPANGIDKATPSKKSATKPKSAASINDDSPTAGKAKRGRKPKAAVKRLGSDEEDEVPVKGEAKDEAAAEDDVKGEALDDDEVWNHPEH